MVLRLIATTGVAAVAPIALPARRRGHWRLAVLDRLGEAAAICDRTGHIRHASAALGALIGGQPSGQALGAALGLNDCPAVLDAALGGTAAFSLDVPGHCADGTEVKLHLAATPVACGDWLVVVSEARFAAQTAQAFMH